MSGKFLAFKCISDLLLQVHDKCYLIHQRWCKEVDFIVLNLSWKYIYTNKSWGQDWADHAVTNSVGTWLWTSVSFSEPYFIFYLQSIYVSLPQLYLLSKYPLYSQFSICSILYLLLLFILFSLVSKFSLQGKLQF